MGLVYTATFLASLIICFTAHLANGKELTEKNYNSEDTISLDATFDELNEDTNKPLFSSKREARQTGDVDGYCVTSTGLSGTCTTAKECYPRLFPLDGNGSDTPSQTGVYNPNLARLLIEASGFCGRSESQRSGQEKVASFRSEDEICCAATNISRDFPLDNDTATIDVLDSKCGLLKIDPTILPSVEMDKIVGGRKAVLGEFPWMVAMLRRGQQFCGGSLLNNRNVLTAAHCVEFMTKNDVAALRIHLGDLDIASTKETNHVERKAKRVLYHKGFTMKNLEHDIALIHLDKPVEFSKTIQPVCLHTGNPAYDTGKENAAVAGWGTTYSGGPQSSTLLTVNLKVITQEECNKKYSEAKKKIGRGMVCAGSKGKDSCQGDSGGPLVVDSRGQAKQIGIVSWGIGCATYPGVYTRVDKYMKWISKNMQ